MEAAAAGNLGSATVIDQQLLHLDQLGRPEQPEHRPVVLRPAEIWSVQHHHQLPPRAAAAAAARRRRDIMSATHASSATPPR